MPKYIVIAEYGDKRYYHKFPGNWISLSHLIEELEENFGVTTGSLSLYVGKPTRCLHRLHSTKDLKVALSHMPGGTSLTVYCVRSDTVEPTVSWSCDHRYQKTLARFVPHKVMCHYSGTKPKWHSRALPRHWADAPPHALSTEDDVRHLQYRLTRLGFMLLADTEDGTGIYGPLTKNAVKRFRKKYQIDGRDMSIYDHSTEKKLAEVVRLCRRQGRLYY